MCSPHHTIIYHSVKYINDHALQELYNEREAEEEHGVLDKNGDFHHGKCSLFTPTTVCFDGLKRVVEDNCEKKNKDGSYLSEVQIRHEFYDYMMKKCNKDGEDFHSLYHTAHVASCRVILFTLLLVMMGLVVIISLILNLHQRKSYSREVISQEILLPL